MQKQNMACAFSWQKCHFQKGKFYNTLFLEEVGPMRLPIPPAFPEALPCSLSLTAQTEEQR
jgi:hypothetical protein